MRELYRLYDHGGHSAGRSLKSGLLEAAMLLGSGDYPKDEIDIYKFEILETEAKVRAETPFQMSLFQELSYLGWEEYASLAIYFISKNNAEEWGGTIPMVEEKLLSTLKILFRVEDRLERFNFAACSPEDVLAEGRRRDWDMFKAEFTI